MRKLFFFLLLIAMGQLSAQTPAEVTVLEYEAFLAQVLATHPLALQANLKPEEGSAYLRAARGNFDPKLAGALSTKSFDGKRYWRTVNTGVSVPTRLGVTFNAGYEQAEGVFLNPEATTPGGGLVQAGVAVDLGKGLLIDQRRAELQKANLYLASTEAQRQIMLNDLVLQATQAYWTWVRFTNEVAFYQTALGLAETRFQDIVRSFQQGDKPAIDTTESLIQAQNRQYALNEAIVSQNSSRLALSNFLWSLEGEALELRESVAAPSLTDADIPEEILRRMDADSLLLAHPVLRYYDLQLRALAVDRRYKAEQLKPKAAIKYNFLSEAVTPVPDPRLSNYKLGIDVSFPLFLRKERGELEAVKLKMRQTELGIEAKQWELENKLADLYRKIELNRQQIELYTATVANYQRLLQGEQLRFANGESSLFMVNSREQSLIKAQVELIKQRAKYPILVAEIYQVSGGGIDLSGQLPDSN